MRRAQPLVAFLSMLLVALPLVAQEKENLLSFWVTARAKPGMERQFIEEYSALGGTWATWEVLTGDHAGQYVTTGEYRPQEDLDESVQGLSRFYSSVAPSYVDSFSTSINRPLENSWGYVSAHGLISTQDFLNVFRFRVRPGKEHEFLLVQEKLREAAEKLRSPIHYTWYDLVSGGEARTYVLVVPGQNWRDLDESSPSPESMLEEAYGPEEASSLIGRFWASVESSTNEVWRLRFDLSNLGEQAVPGQQGNYAIVKIFYATDRKPSGNADPKLFYKDDRSHDGGLSFGTCDVSIPRDHKMGELESPSILRLELSEDPEKHVVLRTVTRDDRDKFFGDLATWVGQSAEKRAFVFIHGYSVSFEDAARRTAQLAYDLGFDGAPILYSWPSRGSKLAYLADEATVEWTVPHLRQFLKDIASKSGATTIHLIAHSMGNRALAKALDSLSGEHIDSATPHFKQVVLTAPDIDAGVFRQLAQGIRKMADHVTLYASSNDQAIIASREAHDYPRAGESGRNIVVVHGMDTIDVSSVNTGFLKHFYYSDNTSVLSDLFSLLKGIPVAERFGLVFIPYDDSGYWAFRP